MNILADDEVLSYFVGRTLRERIVLRHTFLLETRFTSLHHLYLPCFKDFQNLFVDDSTDDVDESIVTDVADHEWDGQEENGVLSEEN